jgi:RNA polymerase-binding protein DksA
MKNEATKKATKGRDFEGFRKRLLAELENYKNRVDRSRRELPIEAEPDDDAGLASRSTYREATMGKLERDLQAINEIERALKRIDAGDYATCVACEEPIADARLKALPWTRTCIACASGRNNQSGSTLLNLKANLAH